MITIVTYKGRLVLLNVTGHHMLCWMPMVWYCGYLFHTIAPKAWWWLVSFYDQHQCSTPPGVEPDGWGVWTIKQYQPLQLHLQHQLLTITMSQCPKWLMYLLGGQHGYDSRISTGMPCRTSASQSHMLFGEVLPVIAYSGMRILILSRIVIWRRAAYLGSEMGSWMCQVSHMVEICLTLLNLTSHDGIFMELN